MAAVSPAAVCAVAVAAALAAASVVATAAVEKHRPSLQNPEHKPQLQQLDLPSIPTSAKTHELLAIRQGLRPLVMWSAAAGQTMAPTLGRSNQASLVFSCMAVLQTKMMMLLMLPPMLRMQSCRVEARVKAAAAFCSVPPARALQPKMMSLPINRR